MVVETKMLWWWGERCGVALTCCLELEGLAKFILAC